MLKRSTLTREALAKAISKAMHITVITAHKYIDTVINGITEALITEKSIKIRQFGAWHIKQKSQRVGRNPKTKDEKIIEERKVVQFRIASAFRKRINENLHMILPYNKVDKNK